MDASAVSDLLLPYQKRWVTSEARYSVYEKSRRIGISWAEALWSVRRRITEKVDHYFVSANLETAKEFLRYCRMFAELFNVVVEADVIDLEGCTSECLVMPNGGRIIALSSNPTALRGRGGDVTLDEFAFHEHAEEMFTAAKPVIVWGGQLRLISTHNGTETVFNRVVEQAREGRTDFVVFRTTLPDAVAEGYALRVPGPHRDLLPDARACNEAFVESERRNCLSDSAFGQEYLCQVAATTTLITAEEYVKCVLGNVPAELAKDRKTGPLYVGIDVARHHDLTVIWTVEHGIDPTSPAYLRDVYRTVAIRAMRGMSWRGQYEIMDAIASDRRVRRLCIDATGMGCQLAEQLHDRHAGKIVPVVFTLTKKAELVERVKKFVAQERVSLPDDPEIREDVLAMKRMVTKAGNITYDGRTRSTHCDYYMGLGLALDAAEETVNVTFASNRGNAEHGIKDKAVA